MSTYNGWTNYATWRVNLEIFDGMTAQDVTGRRLSARSELVSALREYAEEIMYGTSTEGLARDYALAFLQDVDWWEIANYMIVDCSEEEDENEETESMQENA
jgi:hypothetical protein